MHGVVEEPAGEPAAGASDIGVDVKVRIVTPTGTVHSIGVHAVADDLAVA